MGTLLLEALGTSSDVPMAWACLVAGGCQLSMGMPKGVCSFHRGEEL